MYTGREPFYFSIYSVCRCAGGLRHGRPRTAAVAPVLDGRGIRERLPQALARTRRSLDAYVPPLAPSGSRSNTSSSRRWGCGGRGRGRMGSAERTCPRESIPRIGGARDGRGWSPSASGMAVAIARRSAPLAYQSATITRVLQGFAASLGDQSASGGVHGSRPCPCSRGAGTGRRAPGMRTGNRPRRILAMAALYLLIVCDLVIRASGVLFRRTRHGAFRRVMDSLHAEPTRSRFLHRRKSGEQAHRPRRALHERAGSTGSAHARYRIRRRVGSARTAVLRPAVLWPRPFAKSRIHKADPPERDPRPHRRPLPHPAQRPQAHRERRSRSSSRVVALRLGEAT